MTPAPTTVAVGLQSHLRDAVTHQAATLGVPAAQLVGDVMAAALAAATRGDVPAVPLPPLPPAGRRPPVFRYHVPDPVALAAFEATALWASRAAILRTPAHALAEAAARVGGHPDPTWAAALAAEHLAWVASVATQDGALTFLTQPASRVHQAVADLATARFAAYTAGRGVVAAGLLSSDDAAAVLGKHPWWLSNHARPSRPRTLPDVTAQAARLSTPAAAVEFLTAARNTWDQAKQDVAQARAELAASRATLSAVGISGAQVDRACEAAGLPLTASTQGAHA